jgi:hypothetical protein
VVSAKGSRCLRLASDDFGAHEGCAATQARALRLGQDLISVQPFWALCLLTGQYSFKEVEYRGLAQPKYPSIDGVVVKEIEDMRPTISNVEGYALPAALHLQLQ